MASASIRTRAAWARSPDDSLRFIRPGPRAVARWPFLVLLLRRRRLLTCGVRRGRALRAVGDVVAAPRDVLATFVRIRAPASRVVFEEIVLDGARQHRTIERLVQKRF